MSNPRKLTSTPKTKDEGPKREIVRPRLFVRMGIVPLKAFVDFDGHRHDPPHEIADIDKVVETWSNGTRIPGPL